MFIFNFKREITTQFERMDVSGAKTANFLVILAIAGKKWYPVALKEYAMELYVKHFNVDLTKNVC